MAAERFRHERDLIASVRADSWEAYAWDTGNTWRYSAATAEWFLTTLAPGTPGQILTVGSDTTPRFVTRESNSGFPGYVDFTDTGGVEQSIFDATTISGGALGPNGYFRFGCAGFLVNASGSPCLVSLVLWPAGLLVESTPIPDDAGTSWAILGSGEIRNANDETTQTHIVRLEFGQSAIATGLSNVHALAPNEGGASDIDTTADWTFYATILATDDLGDPIVLGDASIVSAWIETIYLP